MSIHALSILIFSKVFLFMGVGALLAALGLYSEKVVRFILKQVVVRCLLPLLIFEKVVSQLDFSDAGGIAICFGGAFLQIFLSFAFVRLLRPRLFGDTALPKTVVFANTFHNYGFIVYPIVLALYGEKALSLAFVFALTCDGLFWSFGVLLLQPDAGVKWKEIFNPPFTVLVLSVALAFWGFKERLPGGLLPLLEHITDFTIPLALSTIGGVFYHSMRSIPGDARFAPHRLFPRELFVSLGLRTFFFPLVWMSLILLLLPDTMARDVALIQAIVPASIGIVLLATLYDGNRVFTVLFSSISNAASIITIPLHLLIIAWLQS